MMTAYGSIPVAVEAVKLGAFDFLTKPFRNEDIFPLLARIEAAQRGTAQPGPEPIETDRSATSTRRSSAARRPCDRVRRMIEICTPHRRQRAACAARRASART